MCAAKADLKLRINSKTKSLAEKEIENVEKKLRKYQVQIFNSQRSKDWALFKYWKKLLTGKKAD